MPVTSHSAVSMECSADIAEHSADTIQGFAIPKAGSADPTEPYKHFKAYASLYTEHSSNTTERSANTATYYDILTAPTITTQKSPQ